jgi:uncharacterized FlaG/YvyC family protein
MFCGEGVLKVTDDTTYNVVTQIPRSDRSASGFQISTN